MKKLWNSNNLNSNIINNFVEKLILTFMSQAFHTFSLSFVNLSGEDKNIFLNRCKQLSKTKKLGEHFSKRIMEIYPTCNDYDSIFIIGANKYAQPNNINCDCCGFEYCNEFQNHIKKKNRKQLCALELMEFSAGISKVMTKSIEEGVACVLYQSLGRAAILTEEINADFAMALTLNIGNPLKLSSQSKIDIQVGDC